MATTRIPNAPTFLPESMKTKWKKTYSDAFDQAQIDHPDAESTQHSVAKKKANALLAVAPPKSGDDIAKLEAWQVIHRGERVEGDATVRFCVTIDGRKYKFPVKKGGATPKANEQKPAGTDGPKPADADNQTPGA